MSSVRPREAYVLSREHLTGPGVFVPALGVGLLDRVGGGDEAFLQLAVEERIDAAEVVEGAGAEDRQATAVGDGVGRAARGRGDGQRISAADHSHDDGVALVE